MQLKRSSLIFIVGPTAIGKTRLAIRLAKVIRGEVISCDSMQIYKGMKILSQATGTSEREGVRHHLIGILDPRREYSAAAFKKKAGGLIRSIISRKNNPIIAGGSGLYVKALIDGLFPSPRADLKFRKKMAKYISRQGSIKAHEELSKIDPESAEKIHPNDARRIVRALEIYHSTGKTITEMKMETNGLKDKYDIRIFGLTRSRDAIYRDINSRVESMFQEGLIAEVKRLKRKALSKTALAALGLKEVSAYLDGECGLEQAKELLKRNTRRFAKRQLTWFRADNRIRWFDVDKLSDKEIVKKIARAIKD